MYRNIIVHIGLHKTGTTFFQRHIFPKIKPLTIIQPWLNHRNLIGLDINQNILISDEFISGDPWRGNYLNDFKNNIKNIKLLYGDVKIIFGIRKHDAFLLSIYKQYLHQKGWEDFEYIYNKDGSGILKSSDLYFHERILLLKKEFTNVFVYSQETLKSKPRLLLDSLFVFMGVSGQINLNTLINKKENVGVYTEFQVKFLKKMNIINNKLTKIPFVPSLYNSKFVKLKITPRHICQDRLINIKSKPYKLNDDMRNHLQELYAEDWERSSLFIKY